MSKNKIRIVLFCMGLALAGLIALQSYWLKHDIELKENQFDMIVQQALNATVDKVERAENALLMSKSGLIPPMKLKIQPGDSDVVFELNDTLLGIPEDPLQGMKDSVLSGTGDRVVIQSFDGNRMKKQIIQSYDSTFASFDRSIRIQDKRIQSIEELMPVNPESKVTAMQMRFNNKLDKLNMLFRNFSQGIDRRNEDVLARVNPKLLDKTLKEELVNRGINDNYNLGLYSHGHDSLIYLKSRSSKQELSNTRYKTYLFPNDIFFSPDLLLVSFNNRFNFILEAVWPVLLSSILFTLIILGGFTYTAYVIFEQKKLADIKNDFINNMTHEFKTPIATIAIAADTLKNEKVRNNKEMMDYYTNIIKQENSRMDKQVSHVLQMAQMDTGELKLNIQPANVHELIKDVVNATRLQIDYKNGKIDLQLKATNAFANVDVVHFTNAINNLVDNAVKYSTNEIDITIETWNSDSKIYVSVADKGIGMSSDTQKKIFDRFYRATTGNLHDVKGFGLGLSYAKAIIEALNGSIEVKSETDKGSTFTLFIPIQKNSSDETDLKSV